jgi:putative transposase
LAVERIINAALALMHTYLSLRVHLVWATMDRRPWLDPEWRSRLFACASTVIERRSGRLLCAGGTRDHIHLYLEPPGTLALCDVVNSIKTTTSKWIHDTVPHRRGFKWQHGYGAFSVTPYQDEQLRDYIRHQETRHRDLHFTREYLTLLGQHGIPAEGYSG